MLPINPYLCIGDIIHTIAILYLVVAINWWESCSSVSLKCQLLQCTALVLRYLDIWFISYTSLYLAIVNMSILLLSLATSFSIAARYPVGYDVGEDDFPASYLLLISIILGFALTRYIDVVEICYSISHILEAIAILPQLRICRNRGESKAVIRHYLILLAFYKTMYVLNWLYKYIQWHDYYITKNIAGFVQIAIYYYGIKMLYSDEVVFYDRWNISQWTSKLTCRLHLRRKSTLINKAEKA
ncbi:ER lumen protein-retaining receptor [Trichoplax sp. H2]|nr:ER lumen protein-retaining receptor [Trichoplax sp. H2]|eukprot:RDD41920.1 ER lumen protein-retaining receptor [Trichoplax sp. H2]